MSTKPPRIQPRKRVIISSSSSLPTRPSSGMSITPLISACTLTCFTQAPLYSTVLSSPPTSPLSVSADNTPATRAARTSTRVRKRQTASLSPDPHLYHQLLSPLHLQLLQQPHLAMIRLHVNFPVSLQHLLHIFLPTPSRHYRDSCVPRRSHLSPNLVLPNLSPDHGWTAP